MLPSHTPRLRGTNVSPLSTAGRCPKPTSPPVGFRETCHTHPRYHGTKQSGGKLQSILLTVERRPGNENRRVRRAEGGGGRGCFAIAISRGARRGGTCDSLAPTARTYTLWGGVPVFERPRARRRGGRLVRPSEVLNTFPRCPSPWRALCEDFMFCGSARQPHAWRVFSPTHARYAHSGGRSQAVCRGAGNGDGTGGGVSRSGSTSCYRLRLEV